MLIDLHFPKLDWDNEQKAVKQNFNSVINMFLSLLFAGISLLLVFIFRLKLPLAFLLIVAVYGLLDLLLYRILLTRGAKQLAEMEG
jgi:ABC-2 type transport system permease protein